MRPTKKSKKKEMIADGVSTCSECRRSNLVVGKTRRNAGGLDEANIKCPACGRRYDLVG